MWDFWHLEQGTGPPNAHIGSSNEPETHLGVYAAFTYAAGMGSNTERDKAVNKKRGRKVKVKHPLAGDVASCQLFAPTKWRNNKK